MDTKDRKTAADYPQELLDLFHEYQHGDIDRREFFARANREKPYVGERHCPSHPNSSDVS